MKASECKCCKCGKQAVAFWIVGFILSLISEDEEVATLTAKIGFAAMVLGGILFVLSLIEAIFN